MGGMSIAYIAYFGLARLFSPLTRPRPAADDVAARYRFDRRTRTWVPRYGSRSRPVHLMRPVARITVD